MRWLTCESSALEFKAQLGSSCEQRFGQFAMSDANSANAPITLDRSICSNPNERTPGVSIIQPPDSNSTAYALDEV